MHPAVARIASALLAFLVVVGALAVPVAAGLPDPPARPNGAAVPVVVDGTYDGGVVVAEEFERTQTTRVATETVDCDEATTLDTGRITRDSEYGLSLAGPLTDEQVDGVRQALDEFRPPSEASGSDSATIPKGKKGELVHENEFVHVHYRIYLAGQGGGEHVGTIHVKKFLGPNVTKSVTDCKNPVKKPNNADGKRRGGGNDGNDGSDDGTAGNDGFDWWPFDEWFEGWFGSDESDESDGEHEITGMESAEGAVGLLHESFDDGRVPGYAKRFVANERLNVEIDGAYVGVRTGPDGTPEAVRTQAYENPDGTVTLEEGTVRDIEQADDPVGAVRDAVLADRLEYRTSDPVAQGAFYAVEAGTKLGRTVGGIVPDLGW